MARARVALCLLAACACLAASPAGGAWLSSTSAHGRRVPRARRAAQDGRIDIRLRSFTPTASGQLTIEPSAEGGRARLTALALPDPQTQSREARAYVVWANSEGRIVRLGELERDRRGNGGLAFRHPEGFERYTVIVTAERSADAARPLGAPVLSTRANEATALFPPPVETTEAPPATTTPAAPSDPRHSPDPGATRPARVRAVAGDFYAEVDDALEARGGGRLIELEGAESAAGARGAARAAESAGRAYVVVRFSDVPLPAAAGAGVYVMWAIQPSGRLVYMGSLPADEALNRADIYVRVAGFQSDDFDLFVTAEPSRPAPAPSDRRVLSTRNARNTIR